MKQDRAARRLPSGELGAQGSADVAGNGVDAVGNRGVEQVLIGVGLRIVRPKEQVERLFEGRGLGLITRGFAVCKIDQVGHAPLLAKQRDALRHIVVPVAAAAPQRSVLRRRQPLEDEAVLAEQVEVCAVVEEDRNELPGLALLPRDLVERFLQPFAVQAENREAEHRAHAPVQRVVHRAGVRHQPDRFLLPTRPPDARTRCRGRSRLGRAAERYRAARPAAQIDTTIDRIDRIDDVDRSASKTEPGSQPAQLILQHVGMPALVLEQLGKPIALAL
jgi:hypothetical protein